MFIGKELYSPETESSPAPSSDTGKATSRTNSFEIENLLKVCYNSLYSFPYFNLGHNVSPLSIHYALLLQTAEQVTGFCRSPVETRKSSPTGSVASSQSQALLTPSRQLSDAEKLRKVILELVDTERTYVKVSIFVIIN